MLTASVRRRDPLSSFSPASRCWRGKKSVRIHRKAETFMRGYISILLIALCGLLISCAKQETATGPHATVLMRDGSEYAGHVTGTTPTEVTVHGDDNTT